MEPLWVRDTWLLYFIVREDDIRQYEEGTLKGYRPWFVHQLFPEEVLYGYKDLEVHILYHIASLTILSQVRYSLKDPNVEGFVDVESLLYEHFPGHVCSCMEDFKRRVTKPFHMNRYLSTWQVILPSQRLRSDTKVYMQNMNETTATEIYSQFKLLLLFYIETASYIDWKDDRWDIFVLSSLHEDILGFATVYRFNCFDRNENKWSTKQRVRVAQFLIFPCFHGKSFGISLLDAIYRHYLETDCMEINVESPCKAFQTMRDVIDTKNCLQLERRLGYLPSVEEIRNEWKITRKQAFRCREIVCFSRLQEEEVNAFRLQVKRRLYLEYGEQMASLDSVAARKEYLWQLYEEIEETYRKVWKRVIEE
ncbi:hypothetical protein GpartN1_g2983.t1 [Galdieria partita]|uniref:histone acetyltransferase n=1 Tax=Galdieria partita TaxID=83374 RepID=A0A9C7PWG7_9RHOD|nr:hypothetical protein GpartN1_g2983.t1 [Galdieria partita]